MAVTQQTLDFSAIIHPALIRLIIDRYARYGPPDYPLDQTPQVGLESGNEINFQPYGVARQYKARIGSNDSIVDFSASSNAYLAALNEGIGAGQLRCFELIIEDRAMYAATPAIVMIDCWVPYAYVYNGFFTMVGTNMASKAGPQVAPS